jgi:hypothetical protein
VGKLDMYPEENRMKEKEFKLLPINFKGFPV